MELSPQLSIRVISYCSKRWISTSWQIRKKQQAKSVFALTLNQFGNKLIQSLAFGKLSPSQKSEGSKVLQ